VAVRADRSNSSAPNTRVRAAITLNPLVRPELGSRTGMCSPGYARYRLATLCSASPCRKIRPADDAALI
jgi:hypothetical protein